MILSDFALALRQMGDPSFRRVLILGVGLTLALLVAVFVAFLWVVQAFVPDALSLPGIGPVGGLDWMAGLAGLLLLALMSVFLMVPVASAFTGLFLEDVAQAVEDRHYPHLPPAMKVPLGDALVAAFNFFALLVAVNIVALLLTFWLGPFFPVLFWALNGFLLGREYFTLVAMRRLGRDGARALRRRHAGRIWLAGTLMAAPLSVPVVNLLIPVLGAATFTHLFHRLNRAA